MPVRSQIMQQNGIEAELYLPKDAAKHLVVVLVVSGSSGGLSHRDVAQHLAQEGIPALALAYFAYGALPSALHNIPLEYFFQAIQQIKAHPELGDAQLVAMGTSRGAELVLQLASLDPRIRGVIATSPSCVRWGATGQNSAAWTYRGQVLPFVLPVTNDSFVPHSYVIDGISYAAFRGWYSAQLDDNPSVEAATIPIERIKGPILLFSGIDDQVWPSALFADQIERRARDHAFGYPVINVQYDEGGHVFPLPGQTPIQYKIHPAINSGIAYGGTLDGIAHAAADRWLRIVSFLRGLN